MNNKKTKQLKRSKILKTLLVLNASSNKVIKDKNDIINKAKSIFDNVGRDSEKRDTSQSSK